MKLGKNRKPAWDPNLQQRLYIQVAAMALMAFNPRAAVSSKEEKSVNNHESDHLHYHQPMDRIRLHEGHFNDF